MSSNEEDESLYEETLNRSGSEKPVRKVPSTTVATPDDSLVVAREEIGIDAPTESSREIVSTPTTYEVKSVEVQYSPEEESISAKAREAGRSLKELAYSIGKKTKETAEQKTTELKAKSVDIDAAVDAREIQHLGTYIDDLVQVFEDTMAEIRKESYAEQERILVGYRKLLEEQINVVNARLNLAKRLKPGA